MFCWSCAFALVESPDLRYMNAGNLFAQMTMMRSQLLPCNIGRKKGTVAPGIFGEVDIRLHKAEN